MARISVYCKKCGEQEYIKSHFAIKTEREIEYQEKYWKDKWICRSCSYNEYKLDTAKRAEELNKEMSYLVPLSGSKKQVKWANDLRVFFLYEFNREIEQCVPRATTKGSFYLLTLLQDDYNKRLKWARAKDWIDTRHISVDDVVRKILNDNCAAAKQIDAENIGEKDD